MKHIRSKTLSRVLSVAALAAVSLGSQQVFGDSNRLCADGDTGNCYLAGNFPPEVAQGFGITNEASLVLRFINGNWSMGGNAIGSFGTPGWTPVVGDWDGDGYDNVGVYINGTWVLKNTWNFVDPAGDVVVHAGFGGPGWTPIAGDWNNDGIDTLGVYKDGTFKIRKHSGVPSSESVISFSGANPANSLPIAGAFADGADRVGFTKGADAYYVDSSISGVYGQSDPAIISGSATENVDGLFPITVDGSDPNEEVDQGPWLMYSTRPDSSETGMCPNVGTCLWLFTGPARPDNGGHTVDPYPEVF